MHPQVTAKVDIKTENNFTVAKAGQRGVVFPCTTPYDKTNFGKVLVQFRGRSRAYWCVPTDLVAASPKTNLKAMAAVKVTHDPYFNVMSIPNGKEKYEGYHFGNNLKLCRKARRLSQTDLSQAMTDCGLKISQATVCYRENCPHSPNGKFINAAAEALGVPAFAFFIPIPQLETFDTAKQFLQNLSSCVNEHEQRQQR